MSNLSLSIPDETLLIGFLFNIPYSQRQKSFALSCILELLHDGWVAFTDHSDYLLVFRPLPHPNPILNKILTLIAIDVPRTIDYWFNRFSTQGLMEAYVHQLEEQGLLCPSLCHDMYADFYDRDLIMTDAIINAVEPAQSVCDIHPLIFL